MRNFRFRLDPVMRLKEYQIEQVEEEIGRIEQEIQRLLHEIEAGRIAVQNFRRRVMEDVGNEHLIQAERELDLFTQFTLQEENRRNEEIAKHKKEKSLKQQELIKLYQDKKVLERLKERRQSEWETAMRKEESAIMDEIGTQKYVRRNREFGGVILYLLIPIALVAAIAAAGIYTGVIDQEMLDKLPFFGGGAKAATDTVQAATDTLTEEYLTLEQLIGDPDTPMPVLLKNFSERLEQMRAKEQRLAEWESQLEAEKTQSGQLQNALASLTKTASDYILELQDLRRQLDQAKKSELSQYEEDIATTLSSAKGKEIAPLMTSLYNPPADQAEERRLLAEDQTLQAEETQLKQQEQQILDARQTTGTLDQVALDNVRDLIKTNQESKLTNQADLAAVQEKIRDSQLLLLKILHRFQPRGRKDLFVALTKSSPDVAAQIISDWASTTTYELNKVEPAPTPIPSVYNVGSGTAPTGAE